MSDNILNEKREKFSDVSLTLLPIKLPSLTFEQQIKYIEELREKLIMLVFFDLYFHIYDVLPLYKFIELDHKMKRYIMQEE